MSTTSVFDGTTHFVRDPRIIAGEVDNETVMMGLTSGTFFGLNETGSRIWALLAREPSLDGLVAALVAEFAVDPDVCREQTSRLLQRLVEEGAVHVADSAAAP